MKFYNVSLLLGLLHIYSFCNGQATLDFKRIKAKYPGESTVELRNDASLKIRFKEGQLQIHLDSYEEKMYMDNTAGLNSEGSVDYSDFSKILEIEAGTFAPGEKGYKKVPVKDFVRSDKISNSVFYEGLKNISFMYPTLQSGAKTYLKVSREIKEPRLIPIFVFQSNSPVASSEYTVTTPLNVTIDFQTFNIHDSDIVYSKIVSKSSITYSWKVTEVEKYLREKDAPSFHYSAPHIAVWIKSYMLNGKMQRVLDSQDDLYSWYFSLVKNVNNQHSLELKSIVDSLISGETVEAKKVKKIYYWVQENIKYIAVEDGMAGFVPRSASTVCEKRYGDCKDMASIIYKMLSYAGIKSHLTWIGSNDLPYTYQQMPTPNVDNHMIATYINNGKYYFLDATGKKTPFDIPTAFIQGKEALIGIDSNKYEIKVVPIMPHTTSEIVDSISASIDGGTLMGSCKSTISGYEHIALYLRLYDNRDDILEVLRESYPKGTNKFLVTSQSITNLEDRDVPAIAKYTFTIAAYVRRSANELFVNIDLDKKYQSELLDTNRRFSLQKDHAESLYSIVKLKIPEHYEINYLPDNRAYRNDLFGFDIKYSSNKNEITMTKHIYTNFLLLDNTHFKDWNAMVSELNNASRELISLKKSK